MRITEKEEDKWQGLLSEGNALKLLSEGKWLCWTKGRSDTFSNYIDKKYGFSETPSISYYWYPQKIPIYAFKCN